MRFRLGLATGFAAGYVLGTKAGHEQYERIMDRVQKVSESPQMKKVVEEGQKLASSAATKAAEVAHSIRTRAEDRMDVEPVAAGTEPNGHGPGGPLP